MTEKFAHWIQIVSGVVLIIGVVLVLVQLEQAERLTRAELATSFFSDQASQAAAVAGEEPMRTLALLCDPGAELTLADAHVIHALFLHRLQMGMNSGITSYVGGFEDAESLEFTEDALRDSLALVIATEQGRRWLEAVNPDPRVLETARQSPYWNSDCGDLGPITALLEADRAAKGQASASTP